jgi:outer membrane lipoprotein-sorting protein
MQERTGVRFETSIRSKTMYRGILILIFSLYVTSGLSGCGGTDPSGSLITMVNKDNKSFKGKWFYRFQFAEHPYPKTLYISVSVSGNKFHLSGEDEWICDGKVLWKPESSQNEVKWFSADVLKNKRLFWKMPYTMSPFGTPVEAGEGEIAGRPCHILELQGKYDQGNVRITYWIDKETNILLKKEHNLEAGGPLIKEVFECESIDIHPDFDEGSFLFEPPSEWTSVKMRFLDNDLLDTKY